MYTYFLSVHKYSLLYIHIFLLDHIYNNMIYINIIDNLNVQFVNNQYVIILLDHNKIFNLTIMIYTMLKVNCYWKGNTKKNLKNRVSTGMNGYVWFLGCFVMNFWPTLPAIRIVTVWKETNIYKPWRFSYYHYRYKKYQKALL